MLFNDIKNAFSDKKNQSTHPSQFIDVKHTFCSGARCGSYLVQGFWSWYCHPTVCDEKEQLRRETLCANSVVHKICSYTNYFILLTDRKQRKITRKLLFIWIFSGKLLLLLSISLKFDTDIPMRIIWTQNNNNKQIKTGKRQGKYIKRDKNQEKIVTKKG